GDVFRAQLAMQQLRLPSASAPAYQNDNAPGGLRPGVTPAQEFLLGAPWTETIPQVPEGLQIPEGLRPFFPNPGSSSPTPDHRRRPGACRRFLVTQRPAHWISQTPTRCGGARPILAGRSIRQGGRRTRTRATNQTLLMKSVRKNG